MLLLEGPSAKSSRSATSPNASTNVSTQTWWLEKLRQSYAASWVVHLHRAQGVLSDYRTHHGVDKMTSLDEHHPWKTHMAETLSSEMIIGRDTIVKLYQFAASENKEAQLRDLDRRWTSMLVLSTPADADLHKRNKILINDGDMASNEQRAAMEVNRLRSLGYDVECVPYGDANVSPHSLSSLQRERDKIQGAYDALCNNDLHITQTTTFEEGQVIEYNGKQWVVANQQWVARGYVKLKSHNNRPVFAIKVDTLVAHGAIFVSSHNAVMWNDHEAKLRDLQAELDRITRAIDEVAQAYVIQWRGSQTDTTKTKDDAKAIIPENTEEEKPAPGQRTTSPRESGSEGEPSYTFSPAERSMELIAVLSDSEQMHYQRIAREVETELQREYAQLSSYDILGKLKFFYTRKQQRKERIEERMQNLHRQPFTWDDEMDATLSQMSERHHIERDHITTYNAGQITTVGEEVIHNHLGLNALAQQYLQDKIDDRQFMKEFNRLIANDDELAEKMEEHNITSISTNALLRLKQQKAYVTLVHDVSTVYGKFLSSRDEHTGAQHLEKMSSLIETYVQQGKTYPAFLEQYQQLADRIVTDRWASLSREQYNDSQEAIEKLEQFFKRQRALLSAQLNNVTFTLHLITWGQKAHEIKNTDREDWFYQLGEKREGLPTWAKVTSTVGAGILGGLATGGVAGALAVPGVVVGTVAGTKKYVDYTKEQNTHEQAYLNDAQAMRYKKHLLLRQQDDGTRWQKYKAKRQLALYHDTIDQAQNMIPTRTLEKQLRAAYVTYCQNPHKKHARDTLLSHLANALSRLDHYAQHGHPTFYSFQKSSSEADLLWLKKTLYFLSQWRKDDSFFDYERVRQSSLYASLSHDHDQAYRASLATMKNQRWRLAAKYAALFGTVWAGLSYWVNQGLNAINEYFGFYTADVDTTGVEHSEYAAVESFDIWKHNLPLLTNDIYTQSYTALDHLATHGGGDITLEYGAGTDGTNVWNAERSQLRLDDYMAKLADVKEKIEHMDLLPEHKALFLEELAAEPRKADAWSWFTNDGLFMMRVLEIQHFADALHNVWPEQAANINIHLQYNPDLNVVGTTQHSALERITTINLTLEYTSGATSTIPVSVHLPVAVPMGANTFEDHPDQSL